MRRRESSVEICSREVRRERGEEDGVKVVVATDALGAAEVDGMALFSSM
jgi:hypothetical protein